MFSLSGTLSPVMFGFSLTLESKKHPLPSGPAKAKSSYLLLHSHREAFL